MLSSNWELSSAGSGWNVKLETSCKLEVLAYSNIDSIYHNWSDSYIWISLKF